MSLQAFSNTFDAEVNLWNDIKGSGRCRWCQRFVRFFSVSWFRRDTYDRTKKLLDTLDRSASWLWLFFHREHFLVFRVDLDFVHEKHNVWTVDGRLRFHVLRVGINAHISSSQEPTRVDVHASSVSW